MHSSSSGLYFEMECKMMFKLTKSSVEFWSYLSVQPPVLFDRHQLGHGDLRVKCDEADCQKYSDKSDMRYFFNTVMAK